MQAARRDVRINLESLNIDVENLSFLILLLQNGSGLDRSSPKQEKRCFEGSKFEKIWR
jgi:hypothetical protein